MKVFSQDNIVLIAIVLVVMVVWVILFITYNKRKKKGIKVLYKESDNSNIWISIIEILGKFFK